MTPPNRKMAAPQHTPYAHPNSHIGRLPKFNSPEKQSGYMMSATRTAITVQLNCTCVRQQQSAQPTSHRQVEEKHNEEERREKRQETE